MHVGYNIFGAKKWLFGDGVYSGNIIQGGSVLQPTALHTFVFTYNINQQATLSCIGTLTGALSLFADGSTTANGQLNYAAGNAVIFQFPTARNIGRLGSNITSPASEGIKNAKLQYSDDGVTWYDTNQNNFTIMTYSVTYLDINDHGAHRWWRVYQPGTAYLQSSEIQLFERITLPNCIVITGAATVAPDALTNLAYCQGQNLVVDGASASLTASTACKGLFAMFNGSIFFNGGGASMTGKGVYSASHPDTALFDLIPATYSRRLKAYWKTVLLKGTGGAGAAARTTSGIGLTGTAGGAWMTGGGGSGGVTNSGTSGKGGCGGPFSGGPGGGGITNSGTLSAGTNGKNGQDFGGFGGDGNTDAGDYSGGGAGNPGGKGSTGSTPNPAYDGQTGAGGVLVLASPQVYVLSGSIIQADGRNGAGTPHCGGGGSGGGTVGVLHGGACLNAGTIRANGGLGGAGSNGGGPGGAGSVNIAQAA